MPIYLATIVKLYIKAQILNMIDKNKTESSNKSFGLVIGSFLLILFIYLFFSKGNLDFYLLITSAIFLILGLLNSNLLTPLNKGWIKFGYLLGKFISPIILTLIYFVIIFPTKLILKICNKDILDLNLNKEAKTYWKRKEKSISDMNKQF